MQHEKPGLLSHASTSSLMRGSLVYTQNVPTHGVVQGSNTSSISCLFSLQSFLSTSVKMKNVNRYELPATADMHVHLRQGELMKLVVPTLRQGGVDTAFV